MRGWILAGSVGIALIAGACGGDVETSGSGGGGAGGSSSMSSSSMSSSSMSSSSMMSSSTGLMCPVTSSPSCCPGDGECCDCVSGHICTEHPFQTPDSAALAFDACVCKADVCGPTCEGACMGTGIDAGCQDCATKASTGACAAEFAACPGPM